MYEYHMKVFVAIFCINFAFVNCRVLVKRSLDISGSVDATIISGEIGEDVVTASIQKIENLEVFTNDFGFLKRIAKVESDFGTNYTSRNSSKGIWQMSYESLKILQLQSNNIVISSHVATVESHFGNATVDFANLDLSVPLNAAVAVRLYLELQTYNTSLPGNMSSQASWWANFYNTNGSETNFISTISTFEVSKECPDYKMDLWFLIDSSTSVGNEHFQIGLDFVNHLSSKFNISSNTARMGMSVYSSENNLETVSKFNQHTSNYEFEAAVNGTRYLAGQTYTGSALTHTLNNGFSEANGARPTTNGIPRVLVVLTDGYSSDSVEGPAENVHLAGITTFAIGVGDNFKTDELRAIASFPYSKFVYSVPSYEDLASIVTDRLAMDFCRLSAVFSSNSDTSFTVPAGGRKYSYVIVPDSGDLTINLGISSRTSGTVYLSSLPNPTSLLHIANFPLNTSTPVTLEVVDEVITPSPDVNMVIARSSLDFARGFASLYFSIVANAGETLTAYANTTYIAPTTTGGIINISTSATTTSTPSIVAVPDTFRQWEIMLIVSASIIGALIAVAAVFIAVGISTSSTYPKVTEGVVCSIFACIVAVIAG